jgi:dihydrofolate reductase
MGRIIVSENVTLDGVISDPTGEADTASGGWFARLEAPDFVAWGEHEHAEAENAAALLMGAGTYRYFADRWVAREGDWADRLRTIEKYVVSSTLVDPAWGTTTVLTGDIPLELKRVRSDVEGDLVVYGSGGLLATLWDHDLVDEVRLIVFPYLAGSGTRVLSAESHPVPVDLIATGRIGSSLTTAVYRPSRAG